MSTTQEKNREAVRKYQQTDKYRRKIRARWYKDRYNFSLEQYEEMLEKQNNLCKICGFPETAKTNTRGIKPLAVDHCHTTGKVRGLLCHSCNVLLGRAYDNTEILKKAISYLEEN